MELNYSVTNKLIYNKLNLDYSRKIQSYDNQTNTTISKIINDFVQKYKKDFKDKTFILMYNDDVYSLIAYQIIKNIQGLFPFNLKVYGKRKNTKHDINKKDFFKSFKKKKLNKENIIYISCFNPIYKVKNNIISFNELSQEKTYNIIEQFTPLQFQIMSDFYSIKNKKLLQEFNENYFIEFKNFTLNPIKFESSIDIFKNEYFQEILSAAATNERFYFVKLNGDESDFNLFDKLLKTKGIFLYFYSEEKIDFLKTNLNPYIEPRNIINENNSNNFSLKQLILNSGLQIDFIGNWTENENRGD